MGSAWAPASGEVGIALHNIVAATIVAVSVASISAIVPKDAAATTSMLAGITEAGASVLPAGKCRSVCPL